MPIRLTPTDTSDSVLVMENLIDSYPEGYQSVSLQKREFRRALKHSGGGWRDPIHGTWVFAADDGTVLAHVRTLGIRFPKKDRRYSLRVEGVMFTRIAPLVSTTRPINSDLCAYRTPKAALEAGAALVEQLRNEP